MNFRSTEGNCVKEYKNGKKPLNFDSWTRLERDKCYLNTRLDQNIKHSNYNVSNFHSCACTAPQVADAAYSQPNIIYRDGYGWTGANGCVVDTDSVLRNGTLVTNPRCINQLFEDPYLTTPYLGRGWGDKCVESSLLEGQDTYQNRSCNTLSEITINNYFQPLIPMMQANQYPKNVVQEMTDKNWVRDGAPSRQIVKNIDYRMKCKGDSCGYGIAQN
jgi:hypothetical protein